MKGKKLAKSVWAGIAMSECSVWLNCLKTGADERETPPTSTAHKEV